jgi:RNase adaptor protein for sRNA GlmZ degradation
MHRSVALANRLVETLDEKKYQITVRHRDVNRK